jgi:hypothetical protein
VKLDQFLPSSILRLSDHFHCHFHYPKCSSSHGSRRVATEYRTWLANYEEIRSNLAKDMEIDDNLEFECLLDSYHGLSGVAFISPLIDAIKKLRRAPCRPSCPVLYSTGTWMGVLVLSATMQSCGAM